MTDMMLNIFGDSVRHPIFSREEMESCLSRVTLVGYSEKKDIFGLLEVSPASSGYCLGSSNWIISSK